MIDDPVQEFALTPADFSCIAGIAREEAGIALTPEKAALVYSRLASRLRALGLRDFRGYCDMLAGPDGGAERGRMTAALTTNLTRFFREPHHFAHLREQVLPPLLHAARRGERVRLWSAGGSSGEEAYSIALSILDLCPDAAAHDVRVLSTDIDPDVLRAAAAGRFAACTLDPVPAAQRQRWFIRHHGDFSAGPALRRLVSVRRLNLIGPWPMEGKFDAIFCRNVTIYFDEMTQAATWLRLAHLLPPGGWLYAGHSERVAGPAATLLDSAGIKTYRRRQAA